jgi:hypothetical protein
MTAHVDRSRSRKKKIGVAVGAAALAAALVGTGALSTLYETLADNVFRTTVPSHYDPTDPTDPGDQPDGALLVLHGAAMEKDFDSSVYNDNVVAHWELENRGPEATTFDGQFKPRGQVTPELAAALRVDYGVYDAGGTLVDWADGGTVASPRSLADAIGVDTIQGDETIPVSVRVRIADPSTLATAGDLDDPLRLVADYVVSYLDPLAP